MGYRYMTRDNPRKPKASSTGAAHPEHWQSAGTDDLRTVRLVRKYADMIDGVDLEGATVGDRLELSPKDADVLIAEGWAVADERRVRLLRSRALAADRPTGRRKKPGN